MDNHICVPRAASLNYREDSSHLCGAMHQSVAGSHCLGDRIQYLSATLQLHDARRKRFMYNQRFPLSAPTES